MVRKFKKNHVFLYGHEYLEIIIYDNSSLLLFIGSSSFEIPITSIKKRKKKIEKDPYLQLQKNGLKKQKQ